MSKILIVAGEASGDLHGAKLMQALQATIETQLEFYGVGGNHMLQAGLRPYYTMDSLQVHGLVEVFQHLPRLYQILWNLRDSIIEEKPSLLICVDYPGFNLKLAAYAKQYGVPVIFFNSPQIWAWRYGRIFKIKEVVSHMLVLFPFEAPYYEEVGVPVSFIGHPLIEQDLQHDQASEPQNHAAFKEQHHIDPHNQCIALLPGSRPSEIKQHAPVLKEALSLIHEQASQPLSFVLPVAENLKRADLEDAFSESAYPIHFVENAFLETVHAADIVLTSSGTASLQVGLALKPCIVFYKVSNMSFWIAKQMAKVSYFGMINILANQQVVPELIQNEFNAQTLCKAFLELLEDSEAQQHMVDALKEIKKTLGEPGAYQRGAQVIQDVWKASTSE